MPDAIVYCTADAKGYVGNLDGEWFRWPAREGGWQDRIGLRKEPDTADLLELDGRHADLALRLSGWEGRA